MIAVNFKTLLRHFIFALFFAAILLVFSYFTLAKTSASNQREERVFINQVISNSPYTLSLNAKAKLLIESRLFSFISLTNSQNVLIDSYTAKKAFNFPFRSHLHTLYIDEIKIEYQHNETNISRSLSQLIFSAFLSAFFISLLISVLYKKRIYRLRLAYKKHTRLAKKRRREMLNNEKKHFVTDNLTLDNSHSDIDSLTGLKNRNAFVEYFTQSIDNQSTDKCHMIAIARCSELKTMNQIYGFNEGDNYIVNVAKIMKAAVESLDNGQIFRLNCSDFACLIQNITKESAESFAATLTKNFNIYQSNSEIDSVAYTGITLFSEPTPLGELLALSDAGISTAQTEHVNACHFHQYSSSEKSSTLNHNNWRQEILDVLENQRVNLLLQPIEPNGENTTIYQEVLARFLNSKNELLPTASFISMAEKLDKIVDLDRMIIEKVMIDIKNQQLQQQLFGINISSRTINDEYFVIWLERRLLRDPEIASCIVFELTESGLQHNIKTSKRFIDMIHKTEARVTVEHFGVDLTSFKFFKELHPDFIKMDSTYTRNIEDDKNNQYFLGLMIDLAHKLEIKVLAESVENQKELATLKRLFIDGCQGFYLGKPQPMIDENKED